MIDNNDNPSGVWIENGEGRVIYDQDGFLEILGRGRAWGFNLQKCPLLQGFHNDGRRQKSTIPILHRGSASDR
jgi:hypothetical protein